MGGKYTESQRKATNKYRQERAQIVVVMSKEEKQTITDRAQESGQSVNKYILNKVLGE